ncbi:unnamed protein product, partial [[Candida] boidinii]
MIRDSDVDGATPSVKFTTYVTTQRIITYNPTMNPTQILINPITTDYSYYKSSILPLFNSSTSISSGSIAGAVVGSVIGSILIFLFIFFFLIKRRKKKLNNKNEDITSNNYRNKNQWLNKLSSIFNSSDSRNYPPVIPSRSEKSSFYGTGNNYNENLVGDRDGITNDHLNSNIDDINNDAIDEYDFNSREQLNPQNGNRNNNNISNNSNARGLNTRNNGYNSYIPPPLPLAMTSMDAYRYNSDDNDLALESPDSLNFFERQPKTPPTPPMPRFANNNNNNNNNNNRFNNNNKNMQHS